MALQTVVSDGLTPTTPQVVIGLLCIGAGIPIAHHVFAGNTADVATLGEVLVDRQERFRVGQIPAGPSRPMTEISTPTPSSASALVATSGRRANSSWRTSSSGLRSR